MSKVTKIEFDKDLLTLINELGIINNQMIFEKEGTNKENLIIKRSNSAKTIAYSFSAPIKKFNFEGDEIGFYNFPEFFQLMNCLSDPSITQNTNKIIISSGKAKINYLLSDAESIKRGPNKVNFTNADAKVELSVDDLKELEKMIGLVNAENIELSVKDESIVIKAYNSGHDNSFEKEYLTVGKNKEKFDLKINSEIFTVIPKKDYVFEIKKEGIVKFSFKKDDITLDIFTAELEE